MMIYSIYSIQMLLICTSPVAHLRMDGYLVHDALTCFIHLYPVYKYHQAANHVWFLPSMSLLIGQMLLKIVSSFYTRKNASIQQEAH